jgi:glycosyltransferase involved in cell wall biosynthesis
MTHQVTHTRPTVSIVSITYNHEAFIADAHEGFVRQQVDFPIEIIVADDASSDATPAIIKSYADRHPDLFRPILRPTNVGIHANLTDAMSAARGEFLALCEGDDFWTDPRKLAKQVRFMRAHPKLGLCFHPVRVTWVDGSTEDSDFPPLNWRRDLSVDKLVVRNFIQTNSVMYRKVPHYDDIPTGVLPLDWYLHVRHAVHGGAAMLPDTMSVYRRHPQGVWYSADTDRELFWRKHGRQQLALFDAMLDLCSGSPRRESRVTRYAHRLLREMASVPGKDGRALILDVAQDHPRLFDRHPVARLSVWATLRYQRLRTLQRRLKAVRPPD